jgi:GNAT superfamily N-acetyltransferase
MNKVRIRNAKRTDGATLLELIDALAAFEKLKKPSASARKRLLLDAFGPRNRFDVFLALADTRPVGYAIILNTYSSFLALPTLFLEDLFVLPDYRKQGIGKKLFLRCVTEARKRGCGRMEWSVLDWNTGAQRFYRLHHARHMKEWQLYRLEL